MRPGEAIRIMTGAPMPPGADAVVRVEDTERGEGTVHIGVAARAGKRHALRGRGRASGRPDPAARHLRATGRGGHAGDARPAAGQASSGGPAWRCCRPATSWWTWTSRSRPGRSATSTYTASCAQVRWCGGEPISLGVARDTVVELEAKVREGMPADLLVTSAGVVGGRLRRREDRARQARANRVLAGEHEAGASRWPSATWTTCRCSACRATRRRRWWRSRSSCGPPS